MLPLKNPSGVVHSVCAFWLISREESYSENKAAARQDDDQRDRRSFLHAHNERPNSDLLPIRNQSYEKCFYSVRFKNLT
jgi:hypothetical protein